MDCGGGVEGDVFVVSRSFFIKMNNKTERPHQEEEGGEEEKGKETPGRFFLFVSTRVCNLWIVKVTR